ncbi:ABC transporter permease [Lichenihabitans sp. Uapishka_5]|uniref:ABC transporter permease n=1 Tax=Lichenihabitans sp. Uapishka_5 TaxID=3037302 RepID=UPI003FA60AEB
MDIPFLLDVIGRLLLALPMTLALFILSVSLGGVIALGLTWMRVSGVFGLDKLARGYVLVFRGSPLLVQVFLIYYGLGQFPEIRHSAAWPVLREPFACAVISLALCTAAYEAEIFRGALLAVGDRDTEAARACGMSGFLMFRRIVFPIALRNALPSYTTEMILMVKSTSLASIITVTEMTGVAQKLITQTYRTMEVFLCAALIYLLINFVLARLLGFVEHRLGRHMRRAPVLATVLHE